MGELINGDEARKKVWFKSKKRKPSEKCVTWVKKSGTEQSRKEDKLSEKVLRRSRKASKPSKKVSRRSRKASKSSEKVSRQSRKASKPSEKVLRRSRKTSSRAKRY